MLVRRFTSLLVPSALALAPMGAFAAAPDPAAAEFFEAKVRPVLVEQCYKCHSTESGKAKGGLKVDSLAALLEGGENGPSIVPGKPEGSKLIEAVGYHNVDLQMPPKKKLPDQQIKDLTDWVKQGATWPAGQTPAPAGGAPAKVEAFDLQHRKAEHWAWQPIVAQQPPAVKNAAWPAGDADRFILSKLEAKGLAPAPAAAKATLIRRATLDLIGLPPTPAEVEAFERDASPDAFAKVVDRLLASPHFGERWGRHWLDLMRYAETRGHEFDYGMTGPSEYRDYVIRAFNADVPYDQLVTEHIAGDLLPKPRTDATGTINESVLGTGFWFLGEWCHSPVDIRQDECDRVDNQIDVFGKAFLGLTISCARCHDHKFDAISTKDYYALAGFLHSSGYREVRFKHEPENRAVAAKVKALDDATRREVLTAFVGSQKAGLSDLSSRLSASRSGAQPSSSANGADAWADDLAKAKADAFDPLHPLALIAGKDDKQAAEALAPLLAKWQEEVDRASAARERAKASAVVDYDAPAAGTWIANGLAFGDAPARAGEAVLGTSPEQPIAAVRDRGVAESDAVGPRLPGMIRTPTFPITAESPRIAFRVRGTGSALIVIDSHRMIEGPLHGVAKQPFGDKAKPGKWQDRTVDLSNYAGQRAHVEFTASAGTPIEVAGVWLADKVPETTSRVSPELLKALSEPPVQSTAELAGRYERVLGGAAERLAADKSTAADARLADWLVRRTDRLGYDAAARGRVGELLAKYAEERKKLLGEMKDSPVAMAMLDANGFNERVLIRGSAKTPGEVVPRRAIEALGGTTPAAGQSLAGSGRLDLARRTVDPTVNPLASRVMVNRVWHHLFGKGIVPSTDNFGVLGEKPSHPELLDALAAAYAREGWSTKRLIRSLMLSRTYQMSSHPADARTEEADPGNALLHRMPIRRLSAEAIRDAMLALSGRLDETMYGPSVEVHLTPFMDGRGKPASGPADGAGRRSIYLKVRRNFLNPMLTAFDMPQPLATIGRRTSSNVPAQALILMNDPFVAQQAELWAKRVLAEQELSPKQRVERLYAQAFARPPTEAEASDALAFVQQQAEALEVPPKEKEARAWGDLAHVLMNVKEFIYVN